MQNCRSERGVWNLTPQHCARIDESGGSVHMTVSIPDWCGTACFHGWRNLAILWFVTFMILYAFEYDGIVAFTGMAAGWNLMRCTAVRPSPDLPRWRTNVASGVTPVVIIKIAPGSISIAVGSQLSVHYFGGLKDGICVSSIVARGVSVCHRLRWGFYGGIRTVTCRYVGS